jgi:anaerobic magnesium-protoporphyrin IX monomethyl ester cyclase
MRVAFFCRDDFNLGVAYLIAYLKSIGHVVKLFIEYEGLVTNERLTKEFDLYAFSCVTANFQWGLNRAKNFPKGRVLFGGTHATLCPDEFTKEGYQVCVGDGIEYFGGKFNPDEMWADREIFFRQLPSVHRQYQIFMTGFGCPFRCSFCNNHQLRPKLIRRSVEGCIEELKHLKERGMRYVLFDDDIFILNQSWLSDFLHAYRNNINLPFTCFGHAKYITVEIARQLRQSACQCVWLGLQSGDERIRKEILNRPETNNEVIQACEIIKKSGLKLMIDHIFGIPTDTKESLENSYNLYKILKPDVLNAYELLYFPKAEINKYGHSKALYQKQGGQDYQRYARSFQSLPLRYN